MAYRGRYRFKLKPLAAALAGIALAPGATLAQTAPPAAPAETTLPEVKVRDNADNDYAPGVSTVGNKTPTPIRDIPQSVTVINRAVMEAQGAASLADVVRNVPGITLGAAEGGTIGNNINLRGFTARTDLYLDGVRDRGQYYRDIFALDAIEVLKGPSSMLFGRGSTGGVINQVSKVPSLTPFNEISVMAGTQPSVRTTVDMNQPLSETSAFRVSIMGQDVHSTRDVMQNQDYGIAPSLRFGVGTPTEITLSALITHNHDMPDYGLPPVNGQPANVDRHTFYGLTDERTIQDVDSFSARIQHRFSPTMTLRNQTQYSGYGIDARESGPSVVGTILGGIFTPIAGGSTNGNTTSAPLNQLFVGLGSHDRKIWDSSLYNQTDLISEFTTGTIKHTLLTGLEVGRDTYSNQAYSRFTPGLATAPGTIPLIIVEPLVDPAYQSTPAAATTAQGNLAQAGATTVAPYVNDTLEFSKQWKLVAGVRFDRYDAGITNSVPTATTPGSASQLINFTSVRTGLIYQPDEVQSYYVSYGTSFNPSLETLTVTNGTQALPPEKNRSYEAGAKWDLLGGNLSLTSALFEVEKYNARTQISPGIFDLTGDVRVDGFEVGAAGRITQRWQVLAGYTYLNAKIVNASDGTQGNIPANVPTSSSSLWTTYNLTREWEAGGGLTYMSNRFANNQNVVSVGNYLRVDATIAYHQPKYDIRLNLFNLADRLNFEQLIPSDGGRSVPGIGRTALLSVTYRF
jgi:catecholate siderophore receptor